MLAVGERIAVPLRELRFEYSRSSGPGGQHVNKTSSRATLRFAATRSRSLPPDVRERLLARARVTARGEIVISSQRFRDQGRNVADCIEKLRALLEEAARVPRPRRRTRPTRASAERRLQHKRRRSETKRARARPAED